LLNLWAICKYSTSPWKDIARVCVQAFLVPSSSHSPVSGSAGGLSRAAKTAALDEALYGFLDELDGGRGLTIIGIDEVGRGSLAGPLTVAAVCLHLTDRISGLNDSKKLSALRREQLSPKIQSRARAYCIQDIEAGTIDRVGIGEAVRMGMQLVIEDMTERLGQPDLVLIDGRPLAVHPREQAIVKGDGKVAAIAAASIIAKVHRDALMVELGQSYPAYGWASNKGYGSEAHCAAIRQEGLSPLHRRSFCAGILRESLF
jgi:ribonuclease HII